jgi:DNA invertase Pin-like site-specific DNA recombinase
LVTLDDQGKENPITKMIISILGVISEMERNQLRERQREGINIAKLKKKYKGRQTGTKEELSAFLSKKGNKEAPAYLKKGYKAVEISKLTGLQLNTSTKIKKLGVTNNVDRLQKINK